MIATRIARRQAAEPAPLRDPLAFLLFYRMDWTDKHPRVMLALAIAAICLASALDPSVPQ
jgi:hypothetical protein